MSSVVARETFDEVDKKNEAGLKDLTNIYEFGTLKVSTHQTFFLKTCRRHYNLDWVLPSPKGENMKSYFPLAWTSFYTLFVAFLSLIFNICGDSLWSDLCKFIFPRLLFALLMGFLASKMRANKTRGFFNLVRLKPVAKWIKFFTIHMRIDEWVLQIGSANKLRCSPQDENWNPPLNLSTA